MPVAAGRVGEPGRSRIGSGLRPHTPLGARRVVCSPPGFRNRIVVALDWLRAQLTFERGARPIIRPTTGGALRGGTRFER